MFAERAGECFVRAVIRIQRDAEDIGCAVGEGTRGLAETARAYIAHHRKSGRGGERTHEVETRHAGNCRDFVERQRLCKVALDTPERLLRRIHRQRSSFEAWRL